MCRHDDLDRLEENSLEATLGTGAPFEIVSVALTWVVLCCVVCPGAPTWDGPPTEVFGACSGSNVNESEKTSIQVSKRVNAHSIARCL